jgi:hypothetical protein
MEGNMFNKILCLTITGLLILPAYTQIKDKLQEMHDECRLVRGHAYMIQQMIDQNNYNESVARAHYQLIDTNLKEMEYTLHEIETLLTQQQKTRVSTEMDRLSHICTDTKSMVNTIREELDAEETNIQRIRVLCVRIIRNFRNAMEIQEAMLQKL